MSFGISIGASWITTLVIPFPGSCYSMCLPYRSRPCIIRQSLAAWWAHTTLTFLGQHCGTTCTPTTSLSSTLLTISSYSFSVSSLMSTLWPISATWNSSTCPGGIVWYWLYTAVAMTLSAHWWPQVALTTLYAWVGAAQCTKPLATETNPSYLYSTFDQDFPDISLETPILSKTKKKSPYLNFSVGSLMFHTLTEPKILYPVLV